LNVLLKGKTGSDIRPSEAMNYVSGYALALDLTARNLQQEAMKKGYPWTIAKGFDTFTPISDFIPKYNIKNPHDVRIWCSVNGSIKQDGNTKDMVFNIPTIISYISSIMKLEEGDCILTGTPEGVGQIKEGDLLECGLCSNEKDVIKMKFHCENRKPFEF